MKCLLCNSNNTYILYKLNKYNIFKCNVCNLVFTEPLDTTNLYTADYFEKVQGNYFRACYRDYMNSRQNPALDDFEKSLSLLTEHNSTGKLLDVGCATGILLDMAKRRSWQPYGIDISEYAAKLTKFRFNINVEVCELQDSAFPLSFFDAITIWNTIEHVSRPRELLNKCSQILKDNGLLFISTVDEDSLIPKVANVMYKVGIKKPVELVHPIHHITHFSKATLIQMLHNTGFEVIYFERGEWPLKSTRWNWYLKASLGIMYLLARLLRMQYEIKVLARKV